MLKIGVMLHSALTGVDWRYGALASDLEEITMIISFYKRAGFKFIRARDWQASSGPSICLTFDDGYLDNWTLVYPVLRRLGVPFTVFINSEFIDPSTVVRPFGDRSPGFLSVAELRRLHESGLADIQSHSSTHTWFPTSGRVIDIFGPGKEYRYPWLLWNIETSSKPYWLHADYSALYGTPVFENDRALRARRIIFDGAAMNHFVARVQSEKLDTVAANRLFENEYPGSSRAESLDERADRYESDIQGNAEFIRAELGYWPEVFCWPGGAHCPESSSVASRLHPLTTLKQGFGTDPACMHRISAVNPYAQDRFPWRHKRLTLALYTARFAWGHLLASRS